MITRIFFAQLGLVCVPLLACPEGRFGVQVLLWDAVIIQVDEAFEGCLEGGGGVEAVGAQHLGDAAVEAFGHTVGLGGSGRDQTMRDAVGGADPIAGMDAGWLALAGGAEAIGKCLAVVGEECGDFERGFVDQAVEEAICSFFISGR